MENIDESLNFLKENVNPGITQIGANNTITFGDNVVLNSLIEDEVNKLEFALKEIYKQLALPKLSWLEHGMDMALSTFYMELQLDKDKKLIAIEEIFESSSYCNRLLIEGKPGYGKTTLCVKLLHDWAHEAPYTRHFQLAFLVPLKNLPEKGLENALTAIIPDCGIDRNNLIDIINKTGEKVLIVLDGFDELPQSKRQNILRVIYSQSFAEATVILSFRSAEFYVLSGDLEQIFGTCAFKRDFSNVKYTITGLRDSEVSKFLKSITPYYDCDIERLRRVSQSYPELFQCPLFVVMFTFLACCSEDIEKLNTKTKLYSSLFTCIIKHSLLRNKKKVSANFNIFDVQEKSSQLYQEILKEFGKLIINNIDFKLQFDVSCLTEKVYNLGFLTKHQKMTLFKTTSHFEAFHKSILEFLVAYNMWYECSLINFNVTAELLQTLFAVFKQQKNSHILQFFFGLCEGNLLNILLYVKSFSSIFWFVEEISWDMITHNKLSIDMLKQFCNFMPFHCYASSYNAKDLKLMIDTNRVKKVCLFANDVTYLPNVLIPELRLILSEKCETLSFSHLQGVRCSNFILDFQFENINYQIFQKCLQTVKLIQSDRNIITNINSEFFKKLPSGFDVSGITIDHLECTVSGVNQNEFDLVRNFTAVFKVKFLKLEILENQFTSKGNLLDIIHLLPLADEMIVIKDEGAVIFDVQNVNLQERKRWYQILSGCATTVETPYVKINYVNVNSPNRNLLVSILQCTLVSDLRCFSEHFSLALGSLPSSWPGYIHLEGLSLVLCRDQEPSLWKMVKKFKNLKSLELKMMWLLGNIDHIDSLVNCIIYLPVNRISFIVEFNYDITFIAAFIRKFKEICFQKVCALKVVNIVSINNYDCLVISELLECLKLKFLLSVQLVINPDVWADIVSKTVIDYSLFQISHNECLHKNKPDEVANLPMLFRRVDCRPPDFTKNILFIQIQLKNRDK